MKAKITLNTINQKFENLVPLLCIKDEIVVFVS